MSPKEEVKLDEDNETVGSDNQRQSLGQKIFSKNNTTTKCGCSSLVH